MAGVKITDLGTLTAPESADLLYIVDISDTSQSPQGTSKQIELGNLWISGTYSPILFDYADAITDATLTGATYTKVGNIVTIRIAADITCNFSSFTSGSLRFTTPFLTTAIPNNFGVLGLGTTSQCNGYSELDVAYIYSNDVALTSLKLVIITTYTAA